VRGGAATDGKPNDEDTYDGGYGVEDSREAIAEARGNGIRPFCVTVDLKGGQLPPAHLWPHRLRLLHRVDLLPGAFLGCNSRAFPALTRRHFIRPAGVVPASPLPD